MKHIFAPILAALVATASQAQVLRIGSDMDYPPYVSRAQDGSLTGFDKELMDLICAEAGYQCEWQHIEIGGTFDAVAQGEIDIAIGGIGVTAARAQVVDFSCVYDMADGGSGTFFGLSTSVNVETARISVTSQTVHEVALVTAGHSVAPFASNQAALDAMLSGKADLFFGTLAYVQQALGPQANDLFTFGDLATDTSGAAIVLAQGNAILQRDLNSILAELSLAGTIGDLQMRWFGYNQGDVIANCVTATLQS